MEMKIQGWLLEKYRKHFTCNTLSPGPEKLGAKSDSLRGISLQRERESRRHLAKPHHHRLL